MTIITALSDGKTVWLGNNSAISIGETPLDYDFDPWVKFGDWALGVTGNSFQQDFLEANLEQLEKNSDAPLQLTMFIRTLFLENYISVEERDAGTASFGIWCILVNKDGRVWDVDSHLAHSRIPSNKIWARGSGIDYALGADFATLKTQPEMPHSDRVHLAIEAAIANDTSCPGSAVVSKF